MPDSSPSPRKPGPPQAAQSCTAQFSDLISSNVSPVPVGNYCQKSRKHTGLIHTKHLQHLSHMVVEFNTIIVQYNTIICLIQKNEFIYELLEQNCSNLEQDHVNRTMFQPGTGPIVFIIMN